jgi:heptosyltransferase II
MSSARNSALPASVLVVQTGFLGDAVLASGMLRALRALGVERVGMLVRDEVAEIYAGHPGVSTLHRLDKRRRGATREMARELRDAAYDAAIVAHRSARSTLLARRAGIARRIGYRQSELGLLHTERVHYSIAAHELDRNAMLVERLGAIVDRSARRSWLVPRDQAVSAIRGRGADGAIVIAPGSVWATKRWHEERFAALARRLRERGERVLLVGSAHDAELCRGIAASGGIPASDVLAGELSLGELVAVCSVASRVVANDSAPLHIAEAVGTSVSAIFGPTVPEFGFGPTLDGSAALGVELPCRPCRIHGGPRCPIGTHECMTRVSADEVFGTLALREGKMKKEK